jgi:hypothetical protein
MIIFGLICIGIVVMVLGFIIVAVSPLNSYQYLTSEQLALIGWIMLLVGGIMTFGSLLVSVIWGKHDKEK